MGAVTPIGKTVPSMWQSIQQGKSGLPVGIQKFPFRKVQSSQPGLRLLPFHPRESLPIAVVFPDQVQFILKKKRREAQQENGCRSPLPVRPGPPWPGQSSI